MSHRVLGPQFKTLFHGTDLKTARSIQRSGLESYDSVHDLSQR